MFKLASGAAAVLAVAVLSGCATMSQDAGFEVTEKSATQARQEPWQNVSFRLDVFDQMGVGIVPVTLPDPLPVEWQKDFLDRARTYTVKAGGREQEFPLQRVVFRAAAYVGETLRGLYDAVVNPGMSGFFVLVPLEEVNNMKGRALLVATSDGRSVMTTTGQMVPLPKDYTLGRLPDGFLQRHPSPIGTIMAANAMSPDGQYFLRDLMASYPITFTVNGHRYAGAPHTELIAAKYTAVEKVSDILISCTNLKVGPGMTWIAAPFYAWQAGHALMADDCIQAK